MTVPQLARGQCAVDGRVVQLPQDNHWTGPGEAARLIERLLLAQPGEFTPTPDLIAWLWHPDLEPESADSIIRTQLHVARKRGVPVEGRATYGYRVL